MGKNKKNRTSELIVSNTTNIIKKNILDKLRGEYYGECAGRFDELVRRGEICVGEDK